MDHKEIARKFINYFESSDHHLVQNSSIVPPGYDASALFVNSGMHPLKDYFLGRSQPPHQRLCSLQECIRTGDIERVGKNRRTLTYFNMLGSWSIGNYWKETAIPLAYELLTKELGFEKEKLYVTVFEGDEKVPRDTESIDMWKKVCLDQSQIIPLSADSNFWTMGPTGPCGPCTEIYFDMGEELGCRQSSCRAGCDCDRYLEIFNGGVFMEFNRDENGRLERLPVRSVDTGAGLERLASVLQGKRSVFETSVFTPYVLFLEDLTGQKFEDKREDMALVLDHLRASVAITSADVIPSNKDRGYVLRRLLRRSFSRSIYSFNMDENKYVALLDFALNDMGSSNPAAQEIIKDEYKRFSRVLVEGEKKFKRFLDKTGTKEIGGELAFDFYQNYGFPLELIQEWCKIYKIGFDDAGFAKRFEEHKQKSREGADKKFGASKNEQN